MISRSRFAPSLVAAVLLVLLGLLIQRPAVGQQVLVALDSITAADLRRDVYILASDDMRGRLVGTDENRVAAQFIEERFEQLGLRTATPDATYRQPFELLTTKLGPKNTLQTRVGGRVETAEFSTDFHPQPFTGTGRAEGPVVFVGFGISAPELAHDDYQNVDVAGKVVLALEHEPGEFDPGSAFAGVVSSEHGRSLRKALEAQRRGAAAIVFVADVHNHTPPRSLRETMRSTWPRQPRRVPSYQLAAWVGRLHIPAIRISTDQGDILVRRAGDTLHALASRAETIGGNTPVEIPDVTLELVTSVSRFLTSADNVVGLIEGADPTLRHEWLILCAHYDHEGTDGTRIFTGADDDASGVAGLLEIAEAYALASRQGHRPRRSILLAAWNAEEQGLLGAWAYTEQPLAPLKDTVAVINMDMIGRNEEVPSDGGHRFGGLEPQTAESNRNAVNILGYSYSTDLRAATESANDTTNLVLRFRYDNNSSNLIRRSDHWPFLFNRVPALFVHTGLHPDYHTERDRPDTLDYDKMARVVRLVYQLSWDLSLRDSRPSLTAPRERDAAFSRRGMPSGGVAARPYVSGLLPRRALRGPTASSSQRGRGATRDTPHGMLDESPAPAFTGRPVLEAALHLHRQSEHLEILSTRHPNGAKPGEVRRQPLDVEEAVSALPQPLDQDAERNFRGAGRGMKHRFSEECSS